MLQINAWKNNVRKKVQIIWERVNNKRYNNKEFLLPHQEIYGGESGLVFSSLPSYLVLLTFILSFFANSQLPPASTLVAAGATIYTRTLCILRH